MGGRINEIFASIQGEGIYCGERQVFVRFAGCNLRCNYCDTDFSRNAALRADELCARIAAFGKSFHSISFTGGEPLVQKDFLKPALRLVKEAGYTTYLETNGTLPEALQEVIEHTDIIAMDIKLPSSSGIADAYWQEHLQFLRCAKAKDVFVKAVITTATTDNDFITMLDLLAQEDYAGALVLQPHSEEMDRLTRRLDFLKGLGDNYQFPVCVIPQVHKIIGVR